MAPGDRRAPTWEEVLPRVFLWDGHLFARRPRARLAWHYSGPSYITPHSPQGLGVTVSVTPAARPTMAHAETAIGAAKQHLDYWKLSGTSRADDAAE